MKKVYRVRQRPDRAGQLRVADEFGCQFAQGTQHEGPFVHPRMGQRQLGVTSHLVAHEQDVDVEGARTQRTSRVR